MVKCIIFKLERLECKQKDEPVYQTITRLLSESRL